MHEQTQSRTGVFRSPFGKSQVALCYRRNNGIDPLKKQLDKKKQSELSRPIPPNTVESDHRCISRIYFDNADDNVTLTLYNVTLTSQKPCLHNNKCNCSKTNGLDKVCMFFFQ